MRKRPGELPLGVMLAEYRRGRSDAGLAADDDDQLSAFRRSNDELTFIDFLIGKAAFSEHGYAGTARDAVKDIAQFIKQTQ